jgi:DNA mismatch endonuclease (patch repair protein)
MGMADIFSRKKRSEIMSKIHQPTRLEMRVHEWLRSRGIPHEMYPKVEGRPDVRIVLPDGSDLYLFIDGCFWHACPKHYRRPKTNTEFWVKHIEEAEKRRAERRARLPYRWVRIWECEVKDSSFEAVILRLMGKA